MLGLLLLHTLNQAAWASGVVASGVLGLLLLHTLERDGGTTGVDDSPLQLAGLCEEPISTRCGGLTFVLLPSTRYIWVKKRKFDCVISSSDFTPALLHLCLSTTSLISIIFLQCFQLVAALLYIALESAVHQLAHDSFVHVLVPVSPL